MTITIPPPNDLKPLSPDLILHSTAIQRIENNLHQPPSRGGWIPCAKNFVGEESDFKIREF